MHYPQDAENEQEPIAPPVEVVDEVEVVAAKAEEPAEVAMVVLPSKAAVFGVAKPVSAENVWD